MAANTFPDSLDLPRPTVRVTLYLVFVRVVCTPR